MTHHTGVAIGIFLVVVCCIRGDCPALPQRAHVQVRVCGWVMCF